MTMKFGRIAGGRVWDATASAPMQAIVARSARNADRTFTLDIALSFSVAPHFGSYSANEYNVSPAATRTYCRPSIMYVSGAFEMPPMCECHIGLPVAASRATMLPPASPPNSSFPAVDIRPLPPPPPPAVGYFTRQTVLPVW